MMWWDDASSPRYATCLLKSRLRLKILLGLEKAARYRELIESTTTKPNFDVT
jgi:hypothetical protein